MHEVHLFPSTPLQLCLVALGRAAPCAVPTGVADLCRCERQGRRVYAVSFASWTRSVVKNVPEVSTALQEKGKMLSQQHLQSRL